MMFERNRGSHHVIAPIAARGEVRVIEVDRHTGFEVCGTHMKLSVRPRRQRHPTIEIDGDRHNETKIVVGVLANQIDAAGSPVDPSRTAVGSLECSSDGRRACSFAALITPEDWWAPSSY